MTIGVLRRCHCFLSLSLPASVSARAMAAEAAVEGILARISPSLEQKTLSIAIKSFDHSLNPLLIAQQVISNPAAALQRFNELQAQIQALQITQETPNISFISLITPLFSPVPVMTAPPVYASLDPQAMAMIAQIVA